MSDTYVEPALYGVNLWGDPVEPPSRGKIADDFYFPPFSVLNAREGFWQERKRAWLAMGIKSELGRGVNLQPLAAEDLGHNLNGYRDAKSQANKSAPSGSALPAANYANHERGSGSAIVGTSANATPASNLARCFGQDLMRGENGNFPQRRTDPGLTWVGGGRDYDDLDETSRKILAASSSGTSIFDPVLTELAYRWFCPPSGQILDPFAGGSVRGIVASCLGRNYTGIDLRPEQIASNETQAAEICDSGPVPKWIVGDSCGLDGMNVPPADFVFSCPPYGDLERYSDDPRDLSAQSHDDFLRNYRTIIGKACGRLKDNRFAAFVVGDYRDAKGNYRNFPGETVAAFLTAGLRLYNEAILVTAVGSLPIRIGKQFTSSRKLGKTHQNVLVFVKGDGKAAAKACGLLEAQ